jgi:hypothetical protein
MLFSPRAQQNTDILQMYRLTIRATDESVPTPLLNQMEEALARGAVQEGH